MISAERIIFFGCSCQYHVCMNLKVFDLECGTLWYSKIENRVLGVIYNSLRSCGIYYKIPVLRVATVS